MPDDDPPRPVVVAVVGLGYWGPNLLRVLSEDTGAAVKWMCDLDEDRLHQLQRRYPFVAATTQLDEVLAGKHTFVEKPLAPSAPRADALIRLANESDRVLMCGHTFVYSPPVRTLKRMLDERALGAVYFVSSSRVNLGLHQRDVSVVWDLGPHDFSILLYWLGELPRTIRAIGRDSVVHGIADVAFIAMTFPSGIVANVELSWLAPSKLRRTVIVGSDKMAVYVDGAAEPVRLFDHGVVYRDPETFGQYHLSYRTGDIVSPKVDTCEPLAAEVADFLRAVREGDCMPWHAALARDVVMVTATAERSVREGGAEIRLEDPIGPSALVEAPA